MPRAARVWLNEPVEMAWKHLLVLLLVIIAAIWLVQREATAGLEDYSDSNQRETLNSAISRCDQANLQRAYELANRQDGAFRYQLVLDLQPIVNCPPTIDTGHVVLVTKAVQRKYVEMVIDKRCWPKLDPDGSGEIVGCRPLPSASQMP